MGFLSSSSQVDASTCAENTSPSGWFQRGAQAAELDALVVVVEAQLALSVVEEGFAAVRAHRAQVERQLPIGGHAPRALHGTAARTASSAAVMSVSSPMSAAVR